MANLLDFYFEQLVTEGDMDTLQANLEFADRRIMADQGYEGIVQNFGVVEHNPTPDLTVDIAGPGIAYDQEGQRINMPTGTTLDVSVDSNSNSTAVVGGGNEKWVSVFVRFTRNESDLRFDGNGVPVFFSNAESFEFVVVQGAEAAAGFATRPALLSDGLLIADILLAFGDTQIFDAAIESEDVVTNPTSRFEFIFNLTASSPAIVRVGPLPDAMQAVLTELNSHIAELGNAHLADAVDFDASNLPIPAAWTDTAAASDVQAALDGIVNDLSQTDGAELIGVAVTAQWAGSEALAAATVDAALEEIVGDLADATDPDGAGRIGYDNSGTNLAAANVADAIDEIANAWAFDLGFDDVVWDHTGGNPQEAVSGHTNATDSVSFDFPHYAFASGVTTSIMFPIQLPDRYDGNGISVDLFWFQITSDTADVDLAVAVRGYNDGSVPATSDYVFTDFTAVGNGADNQMNVDTVTISDVNLGGLVAGGLGMLAIRRNGGTDASTETARIVGARVSNV